MSFNISNKIGLQHLLWNEGRQRLHAKARAIAGLIIKDTSHLKLQSFAEYTRKDISSISRMSSALALQLDDPKILDLIEQVKSKLKEVNK